MYQPMQQNQEVNEGAGMQQLLAELKTRGISLSLEGDRLGISAAKGALDAELRERLRQNKEKLIALLRSQESAYNEAATVAPAHDKRYEPFALTDVQHAYWMGRSPYVELGGGAHFYIELERDGLDIERLNAALRKVIDRHDMLRAVIGADGRQHVLPEVPPYEIAVHDMREQSSDERDTELLALRGRMSHNKLPLDLWPLFEIRAVRLDDRRLRMFISLDVLLVDASSMFIFFEDWRRFYEDPAWCPPQLQLSYRDYAEFERTLPDQPAYLRAKDYWTKRLDDLPAAPGLPLAVQPNQVRKTEFTRRVATLTEPQWRTLKERAQKYGATPSVLLMTAFSEVLRAWSKEPDFTLNLTMYNRFPIHPEVSQLIGDFTTTSLLAVRAKPGDTFADRLQRVHGQLAEDLEYREYSGMRVLRDRARRLGNVPGVAMPIVFTSMLGLAAQQSTMEGIHFFGDYVYGITQTPQIWLDHQMEESNGRLALIWDGIDALFPAGMLDAMFGAYIEMLQNLVGDESAWTRPGSLISLPFDQKEERRLANATQRDISETMLHALVAKQYTLRGDAPAVITETRELSYRELGGYAYRIARRLQECGVCPGDMVAVAMEKGWEQIAAVLGILHAGAAYLPVDPRWPQERRWHVARQGKVTVVLTQLALKETLPWPDGILLVGTDDVNVAACDASPFDIPQRPDELAYVLFTSGSTGEPKGVMIEHRNAGNTVQDINLRFKAGSSDRVLALSALHFDLSVYDIFGVLSVGGAIVMPSANRLTDPAHWTELVQRHRVTLWNSVPQLLQLWVDYLTQHQLSYEGLRWTILSGDWIPVPLPEKTRAVCPNVQVIASGGPTETSIWCTHYFVGEVPSHWKSIPYGKPLSNQTMHIYDDALEPKPVWAAGEIYIGGIAVGRGYLNAPEKTAEKFITHPKTGERLYKSGDLGRYLPGGDIEFLGREDFQVKINGYRIELGEIASRLRTQAGVRDAVVSVTGSADNGSRKLVAYLVVEDNSRTTWEEKVTSREIDRVLAAVLPDYMLPRHYMILDRLPLSANGKVNYAALPVPSREKAEESVAPRSENEKKLFAIWTSVLERDDFGINTAFFELGGDSLKAIAVIARVQEEFQFPGAGQQDLLQEMFLRPTIADFSDFIARYQSGNGRE